MKKKIYDDEGEEVDDDDNPFFVPEDTEVHTNSGLLRVIPVLIATAPISKEPFGIETAPAPPSTSLQTVYKPNRNTY